MKKNRYLIFCGECYYASGGARDFYKSVDTLEEAIESAKEAFSMRSIREELPWEEYPEDRFEYDKIEWSHVFDLQEQKIVHREGRDALGSDSLGYHPLPIVTLMVKKKSTDEPRFVELSKEHPLINKIGLKHDDETFLRLLMFELGENSWSGDCNRALLLDESVEPKDDNLEEYKIERFEYKKEVFYAMDSYGTRFRKNED